MYRKSYSFNDMPERIGEPAKITNDKNSQVHKNPAGNAGLVQDGKILGQFELDDIILVLIAALLLSEDCNDKLLFLALGFVFLSGLN